jgi:hypothetical protein
MAARLDPWKISEVLKYLGKKFPECRLDEFPRGSGVAHLFVVTEPAADPRKRQRHNLLITRGFFDRFSDPTSLAQALEAAAVAGSLTKAGDRTIDLR